MKRINWAELKTNLDIYITLLLSVLLLILETYFEELVENLPFNDPTSRLVLIVVMALFLTLLLAFVRRSPEMVGGVLLIAGLLIGVRGFIYLYPGDFSLKRLSSDFYANASTELISIAVTVLIIDVINRQRGKQQELSDLKWQMASRDNTLAKEAVRKLRGNKWLIDGTLKGIDLRGANLRGAGLYKANLEGADLRKVKLNDAYLVGANLRNANVTVEQLATAQNLKYATMPDGRKYEEWEPIIPERPTDSLTMEKPEPENGKDSRLLLLLTGAGITVFSSVLSLWLYGRWGKQCGE